MAWLVGCSIDTALMLLFSVNRYVRVLGAFYLRLTGTVADVYQYLEPLYNDYRKIRHKLSDGRMHPLSPNFTVLKPQIIFSHW